MDRKSRNGEKEKLQKAMNFTLQCPVICLNSMIMVSNVSIMKIPQKHFIQVFTLSNNETSTPTTQASDITCQRILLNISLRRAHMNVRQTMWCHWNANSGKYNGKYNVEQLWVRGSGYENLTQEYRSKAPRDLKSNSKNDHKLTRRGLGNWRIRTCCLVFW